MADVFWLSDAQWAVIEPSTPRDQPGPEREDNRCIIPGILLSGILQPLPPVAVGAIARPPTDRAPRSAARLMVPS